MTKDDAKEHAAVWKSAGERLERLARSQQIVVDGVIVSSSALCAVADLALAVSQSYAELAK